MTPHLTPYVELGASQRGRGGVDCRGRARDGGPSHGPDSDNGLGTLESTLPTLIPSYTYPSPEMFIPPDTCTSPSIPTHIDTSPSLPPHTYTSPFILPHTYTSVPYLVSPEPTSIADTPPPPTIDRCAGHSTEIPSRYL